MISLFFAFHTPGFACTLAHFVVHLLINNKKQCAHRCAHLSARCYFWAELGIQAHIRDRLLDHAPDRGSGKVYDHFEYQDEMRDAVEQWASHIMQLVTPQGVARLR